MLSSLMLVSVFSAALLIVHSFFKRSFDPVNEALEMVEISDSASKYCLSC